MSRLLTLLIIFLLPLSRLWAQSTADTIPASQDSVQILEILYADKQGFKKIDSVTSLQLLVGNVQVKQGTTLFFCDSAVFNQTTRILEAFGHVHINDNDSIHAYGQYLQYFTRTKFAFLKKKARLTDGKANLYAEDMSYDVTRKIGEYLNKGRLEKGPTLLTSDEATYFADVKDIYFKKKVKVTDPQYTLSADSLLYNTDLELTTFISATTIIDSAHRKIYTREGFYDKRNKKAVFGKRPVLIDGAVTVEANDIYTNDSTGVSILTGNAVYQDSAQNIAVLANWITSNRKASSFQAAQHPVLIIKQDNDSLFLTADSLNSGRLSSLATSADSASVSLSDSGVSTPSEPDSVNRYFNAYRNVRIFSDSLQAIADSLFYSGKDSVFRLFNRPVIWTQDNQISGDTIYLQTRNKKAEQLDVIENGFMINQVRKEIFNQVKATRIRGFFKEGILQEIRAKGNAQSVYYIQDEDSLFIGINKAEGDVINLRFTDRSLNRVIFLNAVKGVLYPLSQFPESEKKLRNFTWLEQLRPKNRLALFED